MLTYAPVNLARPFLGQITPRSPEPPPGLPAMLVNGGVVVFGLLLGTLGYYNRKTDLGTIAMGAGSSIVGAGVLLVGLDLAGFRPVRF